jgi:tyrosine-protein phosphatase YwqE
MASGFLSKIFPGRKAPPVDFTFVGTDMHSHFIPGIDDGAKTIEDSLKLIGRMSEFGFRKVITTPHVMSDHFKNTPEIIREGLAVVREAVKEAGIGIEVEAAAEYYLDDGFLHKLENDELLTFGDKYLLFEVSYINCPENFREIIFNMQIKGYRPVMAHPERYPFWFGRIDTYREFRDAGVLLQINANSLVGYYGIEARRTAEKLIDNELVDLIGSDMHKVEHAEAMKRVMHEKYFRKLQEFNLLNKHL